MIENKFVRYPPKEGGIKSGSRGGGPTPVMAGLPNWTLQNCALSSSLRWLFNANFFLEVSIRS